MSEAVPGSAASQKLLRMKIGIMLMRGMGDQVEGQNFGTLVNPNPHLGTMRFARVLGGLCSHQPFYFLPRTDHPWTSKPRQSPTACRQLSILFPSPH